MLCRLRTVTEKSQKNLIDVRTVNTYFLRELSVFIMLVLTQKISS